MKPKIRKSLFIGLGGTGAKTLIALKRRFYEVYGHIDGHDGMPHFTKFLVFDTDAPGTRKESRFDGVYNHTSGQQRDIAFQHSEVISVGAPDCQYYVKNPGNASMFDSWLPLGNERILNALNNLDQGAGQVRLFGRIAFYWNAHEIKNAIKNAIQDVLVAGRPDEDFQPLEGASNSLLDVHIVGSLAGGTGSGMFMDTAMAVRELLDDDFNRTKGVEIKGYFVLPDVFSSELAATEVPRVFPNAAGALLDLDFFMDFLPPDDARKLKDSTKAKAWIPESGESIHEGDGSEALVFKYMQDETRLVAAPFSAIYLINNKNAQGGTYRDVKGLCGAIAKGLFAATTDISTTLKSADDNDKSGYSTFRHKKGWVGSLGVSELIYNLPEVRKHLALRALEKGLGELLMDPRDVTNVAEGVLSDMRLTERGEISEFVTDLFSEVSMPDCNLPEDLMEECSSERSRIGNLVNEERSKIVNAAKIKLNQTVEKLRTEEASLPPQARAGVLEEFYRVFGELLKETREELDRDLSTLETELQQDLEAITNPSDGIEANIDEILSKNMVVRVLKRGQLDELRRDWNAAMGDWVKGLVQRECILQAKDTVQKLEDHCRVQVNVLQERSASIKSLKASVTKELAQRRHKGIAQKSPSPFVVHLHADDMELEGFEDMVDLDGKALYDAIAHMLGNSSDHSSILNQSIEWILEQNLEALVPFQEGSGSKVTEWILNSVEKAKTEREFRESELGALLFDLFDRSTPLLGYSDTTTPEDGSKLPIGKALKEFLLICVPDEDSMNRLMEVSDQFPFKRADVKFAVVGNQQDRISIFRRQHGAPVFALNGVRRYLREYEVKHKNWATDGEVFHVNYSWFKAMQSIGHSLTQGASLSEEGNMKLWVYGLLMGLVSWDNDKGVWRVVSDEHPIGISLRDIARNDLKEKVLSELNLGEEFERKWNKMRETEGDSSVKLRLEQSCTVDGSEPRFSNYPLNSKLNQYHKTVSTDSPFGSAYKSKPEALKLIEEELKLIGKLAEEFGANIQ